MKVWKRLFTIVLTIAILLPMTAIGENTAETGENISENTHNLIEEEISSNAIEEWVPEVELSSNDFDDTDYQEHFFDPSSDNGTTLRVNVGDILRIYINDATMKSWSASKKGYASLSKGSDANGDYAEIEALKEISKLKLTCKLSGHSKKKFTLNLIISNPYAPTSIAFSEDMPRSVAAGKTIDLSDVIELEPDDAITNLSYKASGAGKVTKDGILTTTKKGTVKITVTTSNNLKANFTLNVVGNEVKGMSSKPSGSDIAGVDGWTLWPVSLVPSSSGLQCQFYLLNNTGDKVSKIQNLDLAVAVGTPESYDIVAKCTGATVKASVGKGKATLIKGTLRLEDDFEDYSLPSAYNAEELFFIINDKVSLKGKNDDYDFERNDWFLDPDPGPDPDDIPVTDVGISQTNVTVKVGNYLLLRAWVVPDDATEQGINWESADDNIATVNNHGIVRGMSNGIVEITATAVGNSAAKASCTVQVIGGPDPLPSVSVTMGNNSVDVPAGNETMCKFVAPSNGSYTFTTTGSKDTKGVLYDSSKNKIAENDDGGEGNNFKIEHALTNGQTVYIGVKYYNSSESGTATLVISNEPNDTISVSHPDHPNIIKDGVIGESEIEVHNGAAYMNWTVSGTTDWSVSTSSTWFTVEKKSATNLYIDILSGIGSGTRSAYLTITSAGKDYKIALKQKADTLISVSHPSYPNIIKDGVIGESEIEVHNGAAYMNWTVSGTTDWSVSTSSTWFTVEKKSATNLYIDILSGIASGTRSASLTITSAGKNYSITLKQKVDGGGYKYTDPWSKIDVYNQWETAVTSYNTPLPPIYLTYFNADGTRKYYNGQVVKPMQYECKPTEWDVRLWNKYSVEIADSPGDRKGANYTPFIYGRGCVLLTCAHAYQWFFGKANNRDKQVEILYNLGVDDPVNGLSRLGLKVRSMPDTEYGWSGAKPVLDQGHIILAQTTDNAHVNLIVGYTIDSKEIGYVLVVDSSANSTIKRVVEAYQYDGTAVPGSKIPSSQSNYKDGVYWVKFSDARRLSLLYDMSK